MTPGAVGHSKTHDQTEDYDRTVLRELPQVRRVARRIHEHVPPHVQFEDLVHAGIIGLLESMRSYDTNRRVPFKTYAKFRIRGAILDSLRELDWGSRRLRQMARRIEGAIATLSIRLGRQPEDQETAEELGVTLEKLRETTRLLDGLILMGQMINSSDGRAEAQDLIESAPSPDDSPYDQCLASELKEQLFAASKTLSKNEQLVISLYYADELTMREIGLLLRLGESRVSQIHAIAIAKIRDTLQRASFDPTALLKTARGGTMSFLDDCG